MKVNILMARGASYYFTLKVKDKDDAQQTSCICRALVYFGIDASLNLLEFYEDHEYQVTHFVFLFLSIVKLTSRKLRLVWS